MTVRRPLPPSLLELPFSRRAAVADGVPDDRLAASDLVRPFHGVRVAASLPTDLPWRCRAYQERMNPVHCFSHQTAAGLYGLPLPLYAVTPDLHVSAPTPLRPPEVKGVRGHAVGREFWRMREVILRDVELGELFSFPVVSPELLWTQLAGILDPDDLVALGDAIVTELPRPGVLTESVLAAIGDLEAATRAHVGRRGARAMAAAVPRIRTGPLSRTESLLRLILMRAGFPEPLLNVEVVDGVGQVVAMPDLSWPRPKVVVEYEGDYHRRSRTKYRSDVTRGERYADAGVVSAPGARGGRVRRPESVRRAAVAQDGGTRMASTLPRDAASSWCALLTPRSCRISRGDGGLRRAQPWPRRATRTPSG